MDCDGTDYAVPLVVEDRVIEVNTYSDKVLTVKAYSSLVMGFVAKIEATAQLDKKSAIGFSTASLQDDTCIVKKVRVFTAAVIKNNGGVVNTTGLAALFDINQPQTPF